MSQDVVTVFAAGGEAPYDVFKDLEDLGTAIFGAPLISLDYAERTLDACLLFQGERNFADTTELDAFCKDANIPYFKSWQAYPNELEAGLEAWQPGMDEPLHLPTNSNGRPIISLQRLKRHQRTGETLEAVERRLKEFSLEHLPRLVVK